MGLVMGWRRFLALGLLLSACRSQTDAPSLAPSLLRSVSASGSGADAKKKPEPPAPPPPWADALRSQRYAEAVRAFEALPADAQHSAEVRFAWARARLELGQAGPATALLAGL